MELSLILKGVAIGIAIAAPVGPIGVLCIRRSLTRGQASGLASGLGAATADALYGAVAAFGITMVSSLLLGHPRTLRLCGGIFLMFLGFRSLLAKPKEKPACNRDGNLLRAYASTFLLTLTNPMTLLAFAAIFAALDIHDEMLGRMSEGILVLSIFCGSMLWWTLLSIGVSLVRHRLDAQALLWVKRISGAVIILFATAILLSLLR